MFDHERYVQNRRFFSGGVNWETLGLFLMPDALECEVEPEYPDTIWEFLSLTILSIYDSHQLSNIGQNLVDKQRTVLINDCSVSSVKFDVEPESPEYQTLYESGRTAAQNFLKK